MNIIRHSLSHTVGGGCDGSSMAYLRNADGSFTDCFCSRLEFVLSTEGQRNLQGEGYRKRAVPAPGTGRGFS